MRVLLRWKRDCNGEFEPERDANAARTALQHSLEERGLGWPEDGPEEAAAATDTDDFREVPPSRVIDTKITPQG